MDLTPENYYSKEADWHYMSVSQFKSFLPQYGGCEAQALAKLKGEWVEEEKDCFIFGSYVHTWNEGEKEFEQFRLDHPEIISSRGATKGELKKEYQLADKMIEVLENDPFVSLAREGQKELIITGELFGVPWKTKPDILNYNYGILGDLKTVKSIREKLWNSYLGVRQNFVEYYGYDLQLAIYAEIERKHRQSYEYLIPHIIAVSKEAIPDHEVITLGTSFIEDKLAETEMYLPRVIDVKTGKEPAIRCESCDYCKSTKKLKKTIYYKDL